MRERGATSIRTAPATVRSPLPDERGAIALMAVFMAIFGVAILYSFIGSFEALSFREGMQDAADAAAFDAAVIQARGMNFIVLINVVMAALMAILITIKLLEALCILGMFLAAALAWPTFGASLAVVPPLAAAEQSLESAYEPTKDAIDSVNSVLNTTADAVASAAPVAANGIVTAEIVGGNMQPADTGLVIGALSSARGAPSLPVEDDSFDELCAHGRETVADVMTAPISALDPSGFVAGSLKDVATGLMGAMATWLCDGGSSQSPSLSKTIRRVHPRLDDADTCEDPHGGSGDDSRERQSAACERVSAFEKASAPDPLTGECGQDSDCRLGGAYDQRVHSARSQCDPTASPDASESSPIMYWYELRNGRVAYTWDAKNRAWERGEPSFERPTAFPPNLTMSSDSEAPSAPAPPIPPEAKVPPCGPKSVSPRIAVGYNVTVRNSNDVSEVLPVCSNEAPPTLPDPSNPENSVEVKFTEVVNILGCQREKSELISSGGGTASTNDPGHTPKRVLETATLGDENFLLRSFMHGTFEDNRAGRIVRLALHGQKETAEPFAALAPLRNYSVAAAEYYYNDKDGREGWMWKMKWRARLRRFRMPDAGLVHLLGGFCPDEHCSAVLRQLERMGDVIAH